MLQSTCCGVTQLLLVVCSYLLADSPDALYVAFMGTKRPRDLRCNVDVWQDQVLFKAAASEDCEQQGELPAAHRGFSSRAKSIPIEALYQQARSQGKRLVLCGKCCMGTLDLRIYTACCEGRQRHAHLRM